MSNTKSPLGRGLSSLIPQQPIEEESLTTPEVAIESTSESLTERSNSTQKSSEIKDGSLMEVSVSAISPNPYQPRFEFDEQEISELSDSIKDKGILQPLVVTETSPGRYELIAGERRLRAAKKALLISVPVIVRTGISDQDKAELALIENVQRQNLNPIERAKAFADLQKKFELTQEEIADKLNLSRSKVANTLRLLKLPSEVQYALKEDRITEGHAKVIAGIEGEKNQLKLLKRILESSLNVRETEKIAKRKPHTWDELPPLLTMVADQMSEKLHNKVEVRRKGKRYLVTLEFLSEEELSKLADRIV
jgi:ParB family chromosome partitioning protein